VHIYGSCHAYTSFNPCILQEKYGITSYVFANPGEIIPTTYLRMMERFKTDVPEVALVDIWGLNAYETYSTHDRIFDLYFPVNIELIPFSLEKLEVIWDYESLDFVLDNFPIAKYKDRIMNMELTDADFQYSFSAISQYSDSYIYEMNLRKENAGYAAYTSITDLTQYNERQAKISDDEELAYETDIVKYIDKIIALCEKSGVELIFYRAPYISTENELRKANWLASYCGGKGITYLDLETRVEFDTTRDYMDYYHLNANGATKSTQYLAEYILAAMQ